MRDQPTVRCRVRHERRAAGLLGLWKNEAGGEKDNLNTLLILAMIALPILAILITFRDQLVKLLNDLFGSVFGEG